MLQNLFHVGIMPLTEIIEVIYAAEVGLDEVLMWNTCEECLICSRAMEGRCQLR